MRLTRHPLRFFRDHRFTMSHASDYLDGELDPPQARRVHEHAGMCPQCRRLLETLRETISGLGLLRDRAADSVADDVIARLRSES